MVLSPDGAVLLLIDLQERLMPVIADHEVVVARDVEQRRRLGEPHGPGHDNLVIGDDGHEPLLQVDQQQDGALGGEHHFPDATSPALMRPEMSVVRCRMGAETKSARFQRS